MELVDPEKKKLIEQSDMHRRYLERDVAEITERTERVLKNALIIGGSLALTYFVISSLAGSKKKKSKHKKQGGGPADNDVEEVAESTEPSFFSQLGSRLMNQATLMLLDIAREKLSEYLQSRKANENA